MFSQLSRANSDFARIVAVWRIRNLNVLVSAMWAPTHRYVFDMVFVTIAFRIAIIRAETFSIPVSPVGIPMHSRLAIA